MSQVTGFSEFTEATKWITLQKPEANPVGVITASDVEIRHYYDGVFALSLGTISAGGTIDVVVAHADISGGAYTDIFTATQIVEAGDDSDYTLNLNFRNPNIKPFLKFTITVAVAAADGAAYLLLEHPRRAIVTQNATVLDLAGTWTTGIQPDFS